MSAYYSPKPTLKPPLIVLTVYIAAVPAIPQYMGNKSMEHTHVIKRQRATGHA